MNVDRMEIGKLRTEVNFWWGLVVGMISAFGWIEYFLLRMLR